MNLSQSVFEALQSNVNLVSQLGQRIFSSKMPLTASDARGPWLVFFRISNVSETAHDGNQHLTRCRFQFTIGSTEKTLVDAVRDTLVDEFNGYEFTAVSGQELSFLHADDHEHFDTPSQSYTAVVDFFIWANT